jgi:hypothetical protein
MDVRKPAKKRILQFIFRGCVYQKGSEYECATPGRIFLRQIKVRQPVERQNSLQSIFRRNRGLDRSLYYAVKQI